MMALVNDFWSNYHDPGKLLLGEYRDPRHFRRPVLVLQNDEFNKSNIGTVVVIPLTTNLRLGDAPGNVLLERADSELSKDSVAVVSQLHALNKMRLIERVSKIDARVMRQVEEGLLLVLDIR